MVTAVDHFRRYADDYREEVASGLSPEYRAEGECADELFYLALRDIRQIPVESWAPVEATFGDLPLSLKELTDGLGAFMINDGDSGFRPVYAPAQVIEQTGRVRDALAATGTADGAAANFVAFASPDPYSDEQFGFSMVGDAPFAVMVWGHEEPEKLRHYADNVDSWARKWTESLREQW